eukprot:TRINITY_DN21394_c0_g1_i1.p1 TRINITY_DN21394_c0_g1~~TRINITY_DN21394_c0_g1_i1.p1  ORF type:complete len:816 (+),score=253.82 TRINITY_DN21394_c0_g1_i1:91-2448(+)
MERYEKVKVVGKGSFGAAWLVKRKADGKKLIAKEVNMSGMKPREKDEARNEVKLLSQIQHPNITQYHESFETTSSLFIVMEFADGGDMAGKIRAQRGIRMKEAQVMNYFAQICLALNYLHERHTLHRDLKSQNIFLTSNGIVKLGDFGIATVLRNTMALAHTICGTPYYFSPELCQNKPYNNKSDIWALGCVLYEITTLQHAFEGQNMKILMQKIIKGVYPPISNEYSRDLRSLVSRMLSRDHKDRPSINSIIKTPYVQGYICTLGKILDQGIADRKSMVDDEMKKAAKVEARNRMLSNDREKLLAMERRKQQAAREAEEIRRAPKDMVQHERQNLEQKMERVRLEQQQRMKEAQRREMEQQERKQYEKREEAEKEKKRKQRDDELEKWRQRKQQEQRDLAQEAKRQQQNKIREEKWQKNMEQMEKEEERKKEARMREAEERAKAAGKAYWEMRNAAEQNRRKAENVVEQERFGYNDKHGSPVSPASPQQARAPASPQLRQKQQPHQGHSHGYGGHGHGHGHCHGHINEGKKQAEEEMAKLQREAFLDMKREAARNKAKIEAGLRGDNVDAASPPSKEAEKESREPSQPSPEDRREAFLEMRKAAKKNKERLEADLRGGGDVKDDEVDLGDWVNGEAVSQGDEGQEEWVGDYKKIVDHIEAVKSSATLHGADEDFGDSPSQDAQVTMSKFMLDGKTLQLPNVKAGDPLMYRIEALRMFLSEELGEDLFLKAYRRLDGIEQDTSDAVMQEVESMCGDKVPLLQLVSQLMFCEDQFNVQQNNATLRS